MSNPSKETGTKAETKVKNWFIDHGFRCERKALAGKDDEGDLRLFIGEAEVTIEVKAGKQTWNYNRYKLNDWKEQTLVEGVNSGCNAILVVIRHRRKFIDTEVWIPQYMVTPWNVGGRHTMCHDGWEMMYIDDFTELATHATRVP